MGKYEKDKFEDNPEFSYFRDHYDEIVDKIEKEQDNPKYQVPPELDQKLRMTIDETFRVKYRRERNHRIKVALVTLSIVLVLGFGTNTLHKNVQGESWLEVVKHTFKVGNKNYITYDTEKMNVESVEEDPEIIEDVFFMSKDLDSLWKEMRNETKRPLFSFGNENILDQCEIKSASYSKSFRLFTIELSSEEGDMFISQTEVDDTSLGVVTGEKVSSVYNQYLDETITIYQSIQNDSYSFDVQKNQMVFTFLGKISLESCEKIAKELSYE